MDEIKILDKSLINKIAAGEVIERPESIVKELIENSIDANARKIYIKVKNGGKSYIKVEDNGKGMTQENAKKACLRHSTSKISKLEDIFKISSLGFRGEALASIASVSELTLITRPKNELRGIELKYKGGNLISETKQGCPKGTIVIVKNLFFNTPARKKYLKSKQVELGHIINIVQRYALINPEIHFKLLHQKNEILNSPITNSKTNLIYIYNRKTAKNMFSFDYKSEILEINGFISKPQITRSTKKDQSIYVNKRYVKNKIISDAINNAYKTLMVVNKFPIAVINIKIDPEKVDVNIHPRKAEIKFDQKKEIYNSVFQAVRKTLIENDLIPDVSLHDKSTQYELVYEKKSKLKEKSSNYLLQDLKQKTLIKSKQEIKLEKLPDMIIHGVVNKTYILAETRDELIIIDQHAAAERILYEKYKNQYKSKKISIQKLLEPMLIELDTKKANSLNINLEFLKSMGFEIEKFGKNEFIVRTIPELFGKNPDKEFILDLIDSLDSFDKSEKLEKVKQDKLMKKSCRAAVKAGEELSIHQIKNYLQELDNKEISYTCPHGRPILIKFTFKELEKMFKRT
jgi:DNA mismatch repair protein MutL